MLPVAAITVATCVHTCMAAAEPLDDVISAMYRRLMVFMMRADLGSMNCSALAQSPVGVASTRCQHAT